MATRTGTLSVTEAAPEDYPELENFFLATT